MRIALSHAEQDQGLKQNFHRLRSILCPIILFAGLGDGSASASGLPKFARRGFLDGKTIFDFGYPLTARPPLQLHPEDLEIRPLLY